MEKKFGRDVDGDMTDIELRCESQKLLQSSLFV